MTNASTRTADCSRPPVFVIAINVTFSVKSQLKKSETDCEKDAEQSSKPTSLPPHTISTQRFLSDVSHISMAETQRQRRPQERTGTARSWRCVLLVSDRCSGHGHPVFLLNTDMWYLS